MPETIGRYQIIKELGHGGMGIVYLAHDPHLDRQVVIKRILYQEHDKVRLQQTLQRFQREAKAIAQLDHPAIVPVYDFGIQDDQPYLVMKYVSGGSLADRLRQSSPSLPEINRIVQTISPAIDYIHQKQIVHRDLKPANILFDDLNNPYIADFGLVKLLAGDSSLQTATDMVVGTPAYMSPEQVTAKAALDGLSDIYSLGVIFYQMLAGVPPYIADSAMGTALMHLNEPIPNIHKVRPNLPAKAQKIVARVMAKGKPERYQSAQEFAAAVAELAQLEQRKATWATPNRRLVTWVSMAIVGFLMLTSCILLAISAARNITVQATATMTHADSTVLAVLPTATQTLIPPTLTATATNTAISTPSATPTPSPTSTNTKPALTPTPTPTETAATPTPIPLGLPLPRISNHTNCQNNISTFTRADTIEFRWTWTQRVNTANGSYLEVRIGPRGANNLTSTGDINNDALIDPAQNQWLKRISVASFFLETANDYHWQVAYMSSNQRTIVASDRGCFNIR